MGLDAPPTPSRAPRMRVSRARRGGGVPWTGSWSPGSIRRRPCSGSARRGPTGRRRCGARGVGGRCARSPPSSRGARGGDGGLRGARDHGARAITGARSRGAADPAHRRPAPDLIRGEARRAGGERTPPRTRRRSARAAPRSTMRVVAVKGAEAQAAGLAFETRDGLVRQRTQARAAPRGRPAEHAIMAPQGPAPRPRPEAAPTEAEDLPPLVVRPGAEPLGRLPAPRGRIDRPSARIRAEAHHGETARRPTTIPGADPLSRRGPGGAGSSGRGLRRGGGAARAQLAWGSRRGRAPRGARSGRGGRRRRKSRDPRRLLIVGATAVVQRRARHGAPAGSRLARMPARKPRVLIAAAVGNEIARIARSLMAKGETYRDPAAAAWAAAAWLDVEDASGAEDAQAQTVTRPGRASRDTAARLRARWGDAVPIRSRPHRPATCERPHHEAGHTTHLTTGPSPPGKPLAPYGASADAEWSRSPWRAQALRSRRMRVAPSPPRASPSIQTDAGSGIGAGGCPAARVS